ncbi:sorting nexin-17-like, partial [Elysia marginata]
VRKLQDFESPCLSLKAANKHGVHRIVLRKAYWESSFDEDLLEHKITMNLLYVQANSDIERQWVLATKDQLSHLANLRKKNSKREFLRVSRTLKYYGYMVFKPCTTDYLAPNSRVIVAAGQLELNFRIQVEDIIKEGSFKITRMRCWRITTIYPNTNGSSSSLSVEKDVPQLELSFEYLMSKDNLQWVSLISDQAMLMSMCLQSMVDELIMKKKGKKFKKPQDRLKGVRNGGPFKPIVRESSQGIDVRVRHTQERNNNLRVHSPEDQSAINKAMGSVKKQLSKGLQPKEEEETITENDAFEGIGDDDL